VEGDPAGDALAEAEGKVVGGVQREAVLDFDFEAAGVGVEEGDRAAGGVEGGDEVFEDVAEGDFGVFGFSDEGADAVEGVDGAWVGAIGGWLRVVGAIGHVRGVLVRGSGRGV